MEFVTAHLCCRLGLMSFLLLESVFFFEMSHEHASYTALFVLVLGGGIIGPSITCYKSILSIFY